MADVLVTGVTSGLLYGLLGFAIVVLFKMTGIPDFAAGTLATFGAASVYVYAVRGGLGIVVAVVLGLVTAAVLGLAIYLVVMRYRDDRGALNLTVRTLGLYLLLSALIDNRLGQGQPFALPAILPAGQVRLGPVRLPLTSLGILGVAVVLVAAFSALFRYARAGLLLRGMAADRGTAQLLGVDVRRLNALSWTLTSVVAAVVGVLTAPATLVSADMMDNSLLYVFAGVTIGGLTSLAGAFVGGLGAGLVQSVVYFYSGSDLALLAVFGLFLAVLIVRPYGLFGERPVERL